MTKVSKNIRRLRNVKGLTQDALAEQLFVTRQTVSSWENGRTQPDIETITKLSEVFGVSVEEIIYGEKRKTDMNQARNESRKSSAFVAAALLSSFFVFAGFLLVFASPWHNAFGSTALRVFAFLPFLAGAAFAVFVCGKRYDSMADREFAAVLWCFGIWSSAAMIYTAYIDNDGELFFFAYILMMLVPVYILDAVSPFILYYLFVFGMMNSLPLTLMLVAAGVVYVIVNGRRENDKRYVFSVWVTAFGTLSVALACVFRTSNEFTSMYGAGTAVIIFLAYYAFDCGKVRLPFGIIGVVGSCVSSALITVFMKPFDAADTQRQFFAHFGRNIALPAAVSISVLAAAIFFSRERLSQSRLKIAYISCGCVLAVLQIVSPVVIEGFELLHIAMSVIAAVMSVLLIADGYNMADFMTLNSGLLTAAFLSGFLIIKLNVGFIPLGIVSVAVGAVLFIVNSRLSKHLKSDREDKIRVVTGVE